MTVKTGFFCICLEIPTIKQSSNLYTIPSLPIRKLQKNIQYETLNHLNK